MHLLRKKEASHFSVMKDFTINPEKTGKSDALWLGIGINPLTAVFMKWICPKLNLDQSIGIPRDISI